MALHAIRVLIAKQERLSAGAQAVDGLDESGAQREHQDATYFGLAPLEHARLSD
jgi:hypothetical protein